MVSVRPWSAVLVDGRAEARFRAANAPSLSGQLLVGALACVLVNAAVLVQRLLGDIPGPGTRGVAPVVLLVLTGVAVAVCAVRFRDGPVRPLERTAVVACAVYAVGICGQVVMDPQTRALAPVIVVYSVLALFAVIRLPQLQLTLLAVLVAASVLTAFTVAATTHEIHDQPPGAVAVYAAASLVLGFFVARRVNTSERRQFVLLERASALALRDDLTGLPNRRAATGALDDLWRRHVDGMPTTVLLVDVDHFKRVNDECGHARGDLALQRLAQVLQAQLPRRQDQVSRYGGEEFLVVLPGTGAAGGMVLAGRLLAAVRAAGIPGPPSAGGAVITVSVGVATTSAGDDGPHRAVARADDALYRAKEEGRDRFVVDGATPALRHRS